MQTDPQPTPENKMRGYLKALKVYALIALGVVLLFTLGGLLTGGIPGLLNGLKIGLIVSAVGLSFLGSVISLTYWSDFAGRWGEAQYKEQLEGKQKDKKNHDQ